jgi:hypothetical protein
MYRETCYKCQNHWGKCSCPEAGEEALFEHGGVAIVDPSVSHCGRFFVDPEVYYGEAYKEWKKGENADG